MCTYGLALYLGNFFIDSFLAHALFILEGQQALIRLEHIHDIIKCIFHTVLKTRRTNALESNDLCLPYYYSTFSQSSPSTNNHCKSSGYFMPLHNKTTAHLLAFSQPCGMSEGQSHSNWCLNVEFGHVYYHTKFK